MLSAVRTERPESVLPYGGTERKEVQVRRMFDAIARRYDGMNRVLSFGFDRRWRRAAVDFLRPYGPVAILDVASGTGDMALGLCRRLPSARVVGADLSRGMMAVGAEKVARAGLSDRIVFEYQDCMSLSHGEGSFDAVTVAFGVRNFARIETGLAEMYRVLRPGGHVVVLELSRPERFPMRQLYGLYSSTVIPFVGGRFGRERAAYRYLPLSVRHVPQGGQMLSLLAAQGFRNTRVRTFTFGVCSLYTGEK